MTRTLRLLAVSAVAAVALTGCGDGTVRTGAAATVGNDRISDSTLSTLVKRSLAAPGAAAAVGADKVAFERSALTRLLQHLLLTRAARDENVTVTATAVDSVAGGPASQTVASLQAIDPDQPAGIFLLYANLGLIASAFTWRLLRSRGRSLLVFAVLSPVAIVALLWLAMFADSLLAATR